MTPKEFYESLQEKKPFTELTSTGISDNLPNVFEFARNYAEAITVTHCCKSDSEQLFCVVDYLINFTKGKNYECKPDSKNHFEVYDDFGNWYSVHKKCFSKTELAK
tara:strand:+ start:97 stop:414 length:318 start_codon:yes stop_codon:yes gene_type:complete